MEPSREACELPTEMAKLDIMEVDEESSRETQVSAARVLRKRKSLTPEVSKPSNRRVSMRPRKHHIMTENANPKQIEALYLNKKVKTLSQTLETIYEDPKPNNETETLIGGRKVKRLLTFQLGNQYTKDKIKKRRAKIKKLLGSRAFLNRKKIPMKVFLETINSLELDEVQTESMITKNTTDKV
ncbi:uncharacterized protein LOC125228259 [Leguminivora glycinivorella]|uniref:uncharacterized protein LOC125228259 n=1 Tax=Leguminivora glycinivorella TaxID=1035111 RepID=UPI00200F34B0|nr:uncharacterized protein LOC125228259 [Leguminivora glycinivorella]